MKLGDGILAYSAYRYSKLVNTRYLTSNSAKTVWYVIKKLQQLKIPKNEIKVGSSKRFLVGGRDRKKQTNKHSYLSIYNVSIYMN